MRRQAQNLRATAPPRAQVRAICVLPSLNLFYACLRPGGDISNTLEPISQQNGCWESKESKQFCGRQEMHPQGLLSLSVTARQDRRMMLQADAYQRLCLEHCPAATEGWQKFERNEFEPGSLRQHMATAVETAVREVLRKEG